LQSNADRVCGSFRQAAAGNHRERRHPVPVQPRGGRYGGSRYAHPAPGLDVPVVHDQRRDHRQADPSRRYRARLCAGQFAPHLYADRCQMVTGGWRYQSLQQVLLGAARSGDRSLHTGNLDVHERGAETCGRARRHTRPAAGMVSHVLQEVLTQQVRSRDRARPGGAERSTVSFRRLVIGSDIGPIEGILSITPVTPHRRGPAGRRPPHAVLSASDTDRRAARMAGGRLPRMAMPAAHPTPSNSSRRVMVASKTFWLSAMIWPLKSSHARNAPTKLPASASTTVSAMTDAATDTGA